MKKILKENLTRNRRPPGHVFHARHFSLDLAGAARKSSRRSCATRKAPLQAALTDSTIHLAKVLVAVDFSKESKKAMCYAGAFARRFGASITALHVVEPIACQADYGYGAVTRHIPNQEMLKRSRARLSALGKKLVGSGFKLATLMRNGAAHTEIIRAAKELDVDLIVMGTRGICAAEHTVIGSTAEKVVRDAPCPVLVVRKKEHEFVWPRKSRQS
jgi:universal stress protein A